MNYIKTDLQRLFISLITSPLLALAIQVLDTRVNNKGFVYWQTKVIVLILIGFLGYLTVVWLNRLFIYFQKKNKK